MTDPDPDRERERARREAEARAAAATALHPPRTPGWHAEIGILALQEAARGLPAPYPDVEAYLVDWWPDMPWTADAQAEAARIILADARFPAIREAVLIAHRLDLRDELTAALDPDA